MAALPLLARTLIASSGGFRHLGALATFASNARTARDLVSVEGSKRLPATSFLATCNPGSSSIQNSWDSRHFGSSSSSNKDSNSSSPDIWNWPNSLSIGRAVSGPFIAYLILQEQWPWAFSAVAISGATDWLDGYLARKLGQQSVLGSYLDPVGDKVLICSVMVALAYKGLAPAWVAAVVVGRDVALVGGMVVHRMSMLGWKPSSMSEFLDTTLSRDGKEMPYMKPLMVSKVNTVLQLLLVSGCMSSAWINWPAEDPLRVLEYTTAATTAWSCMAYAKKYATRGLA